VPLPLSAAHTVPREKTNSYEKHFPEKIENGSANILVAAKDEYDCGGDHDKWALQPVMG